MIKKLGEVCRFYSGTGFPVVYQGKSEGELPFYKVSDIANNVACGNVYLSMCNNYISSQEAAEIKGTIIPSGTVVFAKIGEALKLNRRAITSCDCLIDNNAMGIAPNTASLRTGYFFYYMRYLKMENHAESTTVPSVRKTKLEQVEIRLPSLDEQEKIEQQLDKISVIIRERQQQLTALDELVKARFVELFGVPVSNTKSLPVLMGGDFFKLSNGKAVPDEKRFEVGVPAYGGNGVSWYTDDALFNNDTLVVGRVGFQSGNVHFARGPLWITDNAMYVSWYDSKKYNLIFLYELMRQVDFSRYQDAGDLKKITQKPFMNFEYLCPPLHQQEHFAAFVEEVDKSRLLCAFASDFMAKHGDFAPNCFV